MSPDHQPDEGLRLAEGMAKAGLSYQELWWHQVCIGGDATAFELEAYLMGLLRPGAHQHDLIAQALNEYFISQGQDHPVAYSELSEYSRLDPPQS